MKTIALIGKKLSHSFSKSYFEKKFESLQMSDYRYELLELDNLSNLHTLLSERNDLIGLNVTIPYKEEVMPLLDEVDELAQRIGAVNTIRVERHASGIYLKGYNTDAHGFRFSIKPFLNMHHQKALIFGHGGAAKAVAAVFDDLGIDYLYVVRKNKHAGTVLYSELNAFAIGSYKLLVNCTPVGMYPQVDELLPIPFEHISADHLCVDLIYNPAETRFLKQAKEKGAIALNGLSMLHLQADKAFEIFIS